MAIYMGVSVKCKDKLFSLFEGDDFPDECEEIAEKTIRANWDMLGGLPQGDLTLALLKDSTRLYWVVANYDMTRSVIWGIGDTVGDALFRALYNMSKSVDDDNAVAEITKKFIELYEKYMQG